MKRTIPQVNAEIIDFSSLASEPDEAVIQRFRLLVKMSRQPLFDSRVSFSACQVVREKERLTVRLLSGPLGNASKLVAQVCFVPVAARPA